MIAVRYVEQVRCGVAFRECSAARTETHNNVKPISIESIIKYIFQSSPESRFCTVPGERELDGEKPEVDGIICILLSYTKREKERERERESERERERLYMDSNTCYLYMHAIYKHSHG